MRSYFVVLPILIAGIMIFPWAFPDSYWITVLIYAGIYGLVVVGYDLLLGYCGQISLGHNGLFAIGAYATAIATTWFGWPSLLAIAGGILITCVIAFVVGIPTLRLRGYYLAIATMGFGFIVEALIRTQYFGGSSGISGIPPLSILGYSFDTDRSYYYLVWTVVFLLVIVCLRIGETALGRSMKAVHTDEEAAACMGINVAKTKIRAFVFSAALAAIAGSFYAHYGSIISPNSFNIMLSVKLLLMLFLGGAGSIYGGLIGALILFALPEFLGHLERLELALEGLAFMLILIFLPGGLVGGLSKLLRLR
ncbi:MAG: branched-chain amino acid ABC transporter permease [Deltaproteobacteria bacterium]|nr:branched-chain amino acid ABC transporter permease [Deltaproteobacteria bacterium]